MTRIREILSRLRAYLLTLDFPDEYRQTDADALHLAVIPAAGGVSAESDLDAHMAFDIIYTGASQSNGRRGNVREGVELLSVVDLRLSYAIRDEAQRDDLDAAAELMQRLTCALLDDERTGLAAACAVELVRVADVIEYPGRQPYALLASTLHILHSEVV